MVRKEWLVMELRADGWVKVLRGRRPVSREADAPPMHEGLRDERFA